MRLIRMKCLSRKCLGATVVIFLLVMSIHLYDQVSTVNDTGFPTIEFLSHWNSSPHCGETLSKRIHLMYQTSKIPVAFSEYVKSWRKIYPDFELHFWTDRGIESLLLKQFGPEMVHFMRTYLAHGVERSDVARLLIVNHFGGLYADLDVMPLWSALPLMQNHSLIITEEPLPHAVFLFDKSSLLSNAVLYSRACHPFWRYYFNRYPAYLAENFGGYLWYQRRRFQRYRAVYATGPVALDRFARQFIQEREPALSELFLAPPIMFQPKFDADAPNLRNLGRRCLPLMREAALSSLQRRYCPEFSLDNAGSMLVTDKESVTYARHDFLHLGYYKKDAETVSVSSLVGGVVLHD